MVALGTQNFNEFELHLRAILSLPILKSHWKKAGGTSAILASENSMNPSYIGIEQILYPKLILNLWQNLVHVRIEEWGCFNKRHFRNAN
jgi:formate-dependent phosphoribosylglycinamide formyltransferase (GAR transformylase)